MNSKLRAMNLIGSFLISFSSIANAERMSDKDLDKLEPDVKRFVLFTRKIEDSKEYRGIKATSFEEYKGGAVTGFVREKPGKNGVNEIYQVTIQGKDDGPSIGFFFYEPCTITRQGENIDHYVRIEGKKVKVASVCAPSHNGSPLRVYMIWTDEGRDYAYRIFSNSNVVFVEIDGVEVPFLAKGFREAWSEAAEPAI